MAKAKPFSKNAKIAADALHTRYGRGVGNNSAWNHMSQDQRDDAIRSQALLILLVQDEEVSARLTLADAQALATEIVEALGSYV